jgi:hypothetical protein
MTLTCAKVADGVIARTAAAISGDRPRLRLRGIADPLADGTAATPGIVPRAAAWLSQVNGTGLGAPSYYSAPTKASTIKIANPIARIIRSPVTRCFAGWVIAQTLLEAVV